MPFGIMADVLSQKKKARLQIRRVGIMFTFRDERQGEGSKLGKEKMHFFVNKCDFWPKQRGLDQF